MQWSADECLSKFLLLAKDIFKPRNTSTSLFSRVQDLLLSYVEDGQYSQKAINEAFTTAGHSIPMFNPLQSHTRVAVTATTAKETNTCLFTNYNGHTRTRNIDNLDYNTIRASRAEFDATISDA
jgi:hypothetical protein